jgi:hypothetical protein
MIALMTKVRPYSVNLTVPLERVGLFYPDDDCKIFLVSRARQGGLHTLIKEIITRSC